VAHSSTFLTQNACNSTISMPQTAQIWYTVIALNHLPTPVY